MPAKKRATAKQATAARKSAAATREGEDELLESIGRGVVSPILHDPKRRAGMGLPENEDERGPYMVELNVQYKGGLAEAGKKFADLWTNLFGDRRSAQPGDAPPKPVAISKSMTPSAYTSVRTSVGSPMSCSGAM